MLFFKIIFGDSSIYHSYETCPGTICDNMRHIMANKSFVRAKIIHNKTYNKINNYQLYKLKKHCLKFRSKLIITELQMQLSKHKNINIDQISKTYIKLSIWINNSCNIWLFQVLNNILVYFGYLLWIDIGFRTNSFEIFNISDFPNIHLGLRSGLDSVRIKPITQNTVEQNIFKFKLVQIHFYRIMFSSNFWIWYAN